jgi:hypothetical protein
MSQRARTAGLTPRSAGQVGRLNRTQRTAYHTHRNAGLGHRAALAKATGVRAKKSGARPVPKKTGARVVPRKTTAKKITPVPLRRSAKKATPVRRPRKA